MSSFTYIMGDTWVGLYRDGSLISEGHSIPVRELFSLLGLDITVHEADLDWLDEHGSFPNELSEVVLNE